jgi:hypothetical protein
MYPDLRLTIEAGLRTGRWGGGAAPAPRSRLTAGESAAVDLSVRLSSEGVARQIRRVAGPVPGARLIA